MLNNSRGSSLIFVVSLAIILNIVFSMVYLTVAKTQKTSGDKRIYASALALAEAGKEKLYGEINAKVFSPLKNKKVNVYTDFLLGNGSFSVSCSSNASLDTVWVESWGKDKLSENGIFVVAALKPIVNINGAMAPVRGAVTARSFVSTLGNIFIDGRDYDTNWTVVGNGLYGVSTCATLSIGGSSQVGGNGVVPADKKTASSVWSSIAQENLPVSSYLASPEAFLNLPSGALDAFETPTMKSNFNGIQYIKNSVSGHDFGNSSGIIIIHNTFKTATLHANKGTFKGLLIVDVMDKFNGNAKVLGAVVTLGENSTSTFGNGTSNVAYSSYVLNHLNDYCENITKKANEVYWKEIRKK